jgi:hypothetical protein
MILRPHDPRFALHLRTLHQVVHEQQRRAHRCPCVVGGLVHDGAVLWPFGSCEVRLGRAISPRDERTAKELRP